MPTVMLTTRIRFFKLSQRTAPDLKARKRLAKNKMPPIPYWYRSATVGWSTTYPLLKKCQCSIGRFLDLAVTMESCSQCQLACKLQPAAKNRWKEEALENKRRRRKFVQDSMLLNTSETLQTGFLTGFQLKLSIKAVQYMGKGFARGYSVS